jgi:hypothetical protein
VNTTNGVNGLNAKGVLHGALRDSYEPPVNFWIIIQPLCYQHRKYQIIQAIHQYQNTDTHTSIYQYKLPVHTFKFQNKNKKENTAFWYKPFVNKLAIYP